jgi:hypothetical protein
MPCGWLQGCLKHRDWQGTLWNKFLQGIISTPINTNVHVQEDVRVDSKIMLLNTAFEPMGSSDAGEALTSNRPRQRRSSTADCSQQQDIVCTAEHESRPNGTTHALQVRAKHSPTACRLNCGQSTRPQQVVQKRTTSRPLSAIPKPTVHRDCHS